MINKHYILEDKTIQEWYLEIRGLAHNAREKYERCFLGKRSSIDMMHFWRKTSETYMGLNETLYHLVNYGSIVNKDKCLSCKYEPTHKAKLARNFERWYPWIMRCKDGEQFKKMETKSIYELMTTPVPLTPMHGLLHHPIGQNTPLHPAAWKYQEPYQQLQL